MSIKKVKVELLKFVVTALIKVCPIGNISLLLTYIGLSIGFSFYNSSLPYYQNLDQVNDSLKTLLGESQSLNSFILDACKEPSEVGTPLEEMLDHSSKLKQKILSLEEEKNIKVNHNSSVDNSKRWSHIFSCGALGIVGVGCLIHAFWR